MNLTSYARTFNEWKPEFFALAPEGLHVADPYLFHLFSAGWNPQQAVDRVMSIIRVNQGKL